MGFLARLVAMVIVHFLSAWRRDAENRQAGAVEAEKRGLEDVNKRAARAEAADRAVRNAPAGLPDDPYRRD
jgi:hypothetical protein